MHPRLVQAIVSPRTSAVWQGLNRFWPRRIRFFHQVDDPHSHQLLCLLPRFSAQHGVPVELRVVPPPTAPHDPDPERARRFAARDAEEWARLYEVERVAGSPSPEAVRAAQGALLKLRSPGGLERAVQICRGLWSGAVLPEQEEPTAGLRANQAELHRSGYYRGGSLCFEGEHYPGLARLTRLEAAIGATGANGAVDGAVDRGVLVPRAAAQPAIARLPAGARLDWFYSFRSPYSYLSVGPMKALAARYDVDLRIRPVLPMVMRGLQVPFRKRLFLVRDAKREALARGLPFGRLADPIGVGVERLLAVFEVAQARGEGLALLEAAGSAVWGEGIDVATDAGLDAVAGRVGLTPTDVRAALADEAWRDRVRDNRQALLDLGLWGVPSFSVPGFATWGQDRLFMLEARLPPRS